MQLPAEGRSGRRSPHRRPHFRRRTRRTPPAPQRAPQRARTPPQGRIAFNDERKAELECRIRQNHEDIAETREKLAQQEFDFIAANEVARSTQPPHRREGNPARRAGRAAPGCARDEREKHRGRPPRNPRRGEPHADDHRLDAGEHRKLARPARRQPRTRAPARPMRSNGSRWRCEEFRAEQRTASPRTREQPARMLGELEEAFQKRRAHLSAHPRRPRCRARRGDRVQQAARPALVAFRGRPPARRQRRRLRKRAPRTCSTASATPTTSSPASTACSPRSSKPTTPAPAPSRPRSATICKPCWSRTSVAEAIISRLTEKQFGSRRVLPETFVGHSVGTQMEVAAGRRRPPGRSTG